MDCPLHWRHVSTCYRVICAYCAYVTIRRTLGDTRCTPRHFVNKVSVRQFSAENKQESAEFYSQHLPMHSRDVIWMIKPKSTFPLSFSLVSAEMNLVGNYRTLRGLRTVKPEGLPSTNLHLYLLSEHLCPSPCPSPWQSLETTSKARIRGHPKLRPFWQRPREHAALSMHIRTQPGTNSDMRISEHH